MKSWNRSRFYLSGLVALALAGMVGCNRAGDSSAADAAAPERGGGGAKPIKVTDANFAELVEDSEGVVVVDFWAPWCAPCRMIAPTLEKLAGEYHGRVTVAKVNVDENQKLSSRFKIESIPALIMFKDGKAQDMRVGALREADFRTWFEDSLKG